MAIAFAPVKAPQRSTELIELVRAVYAASEHDEDTAVEWKSSLDLEKLEVIGHQVARQIVGFANRMPKDALKRFEGHGYLLIGVEPGKLDGVASIDPAKLTERVQSFIGHRIGWSPEYVVVDGATVLVVIIDPPKYGDPIHALYRAIGNFPPGTILVRKSGTVASARPEDIDRLATRAHPEGAETQLAVHASGEIEAWPEPVDLDDWVETTAERILAGVSDHSRLPDSYTEDLKTALTNRAMWSMHKNPGSLLRLTIENPSGTPLRGLKLTLNTSDATILDEDYLDDLEDDDPPMVPAPRRRTDVQLAMDSMPVPYAPPGLVIRDFTVRSREPLNVEFDPIDLHPHHTIEIEPLPLITFNPGSLTVQWKAASLNLNGVSSGTFTVPIVNSRLTRESIFWGITLS